MALRSSSTKSSDRPAGRRSAASAREAVLELLRDDHKRVKKAFRDFERLDGARSGDAGAALVERVCNDLEMHARLEEDLFYPAVRQTIDEEELVDEAEIEHLSAKRLIEDLRDMSPQDEKFAATFTVLGEYVKHHVREEEQEMFPHLERARIDWNALLDAMQEQRESLRAEFGMNEDTDAESGEPAPARKPAGARRKS